MSLHFHKKIILIIFLIFISNNLFALSSFSPRIYKSFDSGVNWQCPGLCNVPVDKMAISTSDPSVLYINTKQGIYKTNNGGASWQFAGLPTPNISAIIIHPSNSHIIYAASYPFFYKTTDSGKNWEKIGNHLTCAAISQIAIDKLKPSTVYVAASCDNDNSKNPLKGSSIFRSDDNGENWKATGLKDLLMLSVAIDPSDDEVLYAGTFGEMYHTMNGGISWTGLALNEYIRNIIIDPYNSNTIYVATNNGAYKKVLNEWKKLNIGNNPQQVIWNLVINPQNPSILYATLNDQHTIWKSIDAGLTWSIVTSTTFSINDLTIDAINPSILYATSG